MKVKLCLATLLVGLISGPEALLANDPTRPDVIAPTVAKPNQVRALKLTMIQSSDRGRRAVINGRSYTKGERVGGYQIKAIGTSDVVLQNNKGTVRLSLITKGALRKK